MKKGFISALFVSLLLAVPAIAGAAENEKPLLPLELTNILAEPVQELEPQKEETNQELQAASVAPAPLTTVEEDSRTQKRGLLNIGLGLPVIGEVKLDLLTGGKAEAESDNTTSSQNRLLGVEIKDSELLGDVNLEVLKRDEQDERKGTSSGLVSLDVDNALLGKTHVGVLEGNKSGAADKANITANLIVIESEDSLLGSTRIGVGEYSKNDGQQKVKLADISAGSSDGSSKVISNPDIHFGNPVNPSLPAETGEESNDDTALNDDIAFNDETDFIDVNSNTENENHSNTLKAAEMSDVRNSTVLNQQKKNVLEEYKKIINQVNDSETNTIKLVASSSAAPNNGSPGASSGSGAANSSGGAPGLAAYLAVDYLKEIETSCQITNSADELSDQWQKSPPGDPPKSAFFLIA